MKQFPYCMDARCVRCDQEFGDHKSKQPWPLEMIVKGNKVSCIGFIPVKTFFIDLN